MYNHWHPSLLDLSTDCGETNYVIYQLEANLGYLKAGRDAATLPWRTQLRDDFLSQPTLTLGHGGSSGGGEMKGGVDQIRMRWSGGSDDGPVSFSVTLDIFALIQFNSQTMCLHLIILKGSGQ